MSAAPLPTRRQVGASQLLLAAAFAGFALGDVGGGHDRTALLAPLGAGVLFLAAIAVRAPVVSWDRILAFLLLVILFIPIRRYRIPGHLPFQLEPYRLLVALIVAGWVSSLLVDRRVTLRRSGLEGPIFLLLVVVLGSIVVNPARVGDLQSNVLKSVTFLLSFIVVFYLVVSVVRTGAMADTLVKTLVGGGAVLAALAVVEARTGVTPFGSLDRVIPVLVPDPGFQGAIDRGGATRAFGSAEHPIALGAALVMLVPLAVYVVRTSGPGWYVALIALVVGVLATVSRTGVLMLVVLFVVFMVLRFRETRRLWPLILPLLVATHLAVPGTLGALQQSFVPEGGLIAQQEGMAGSCSSSGRVADLGPSLKEAGRRPFLGQGYGTRIPTGPESNACILDNQWLGTLLELGIAGLLAWLAMFLAVIRRFGGPAKRDASKTGWLLVAVTASITSFGVGMFTFDAFSFVQVTFLLFVILGLGAAVFANEGLARGPARTARGRAPARARGAPGPARA